MKNERILNVYFVGNFLDLNHMENVMSLLCIKYLTHMKEKTIVYVVRKRGLGHFILLLAYREAELKTELKQTQITIKVLEAR